MRREKRKLITASKVYLNTLSWDFIEKSNIIPLPDGIIPRAKELPEYPGIYGVASDKSFLYIGLARGKICSRFNDHFNLRKNILDFYNHNKILLYFYSIEFSSESPIGKVFAKDGTSSNYHESHLIHELRPFFNKSIPPASFGLWEEIYYRELIIEQKGIMGFSKYLVNELRRTSVMPIHKELRSESNKIIESCNFIQVE